MTSSIIPYLNILYPHVGPLTTRVSQAPQDHHACVPGPPGSKSGSGETRRFRGIPVQEHCCRHLSSATISPLHQMNGLFLWVKSSATYRLIAQNIHQLNILLGETFSNILFHCVNFQKRNFTFQLVAVYTLPVNR